MNNRDKLLAGARQCLREKGYTRTTARDTADGRDLIEALGILMAGPGADG